ncbi:FadR family transcriptional regulator [Actinoalloteichus sp. AHMU CJ021]|uniref:FadR/GntR family transcriptional regulator n=1 Tax=Actinoalloteichus TaxID=65496 RepID=UPI00047E33F4|nr:FadR/GntR family transcriptional regulator [Actinoalloteichus caeruleus]AUS81486.1 FadR family transcriptional regulator [Actinoalloteichus sp. AHMU CJ021]
MALTDSAIEKIKQMIIDGELRPGDRLPREADLAAHLGLSRSSLREAVRALALIHVLDVRQGDGTYVTSLDPALLLDAVAFVVDFHQDESVLQLFEVRRILEPAAAAIAAQVMPDEDARGLLPLLDEVTDHTDIEQLVANDIEFHRRVAEGTGNQVLCSLVDSLSSSTHRARVWRGLTQKDSVRRTLDEHRAIAEAIISREAEVARSWATVHVAGVEQWLRTAL